MFSSCFPNTSNFFQSLFFSLNLSNDEQELLSTIHLSYSFNKDKNIMNLLESGSKVTLACLEEAIATFNRSTINLILEAAIKEKIIPSEKCFHILLDYEREKRRVQLPTAILSCEMFAYELQVEVLKKLISAGGVVTKKIFHKILKMEEIFAKENINPHKKLIKISDYLEIRKNARLLSSLARCPHALFANAKDPLPQELIIEIAALSVGDENKIQHEDLNQQCARMHSGKP